MTNESEFQKWFESQFGKRPSPREQDEHWQKVAHDGVMADFLLKRCQEWDRSRTAALYAWQAKDL